MKKLIVAREARKKVFFLFVVRIYLVFLHHVLNEVGRYLPYVILRSPDLKFLLMNPDSDPANIFGAIRISNL